MNIDFSIYRVRIGMHYYRNFKLKGFKRFNNFELFSFLDMILYQAGDVEKNPGPGTEHDEMGDTTSASSAVLHGNFSVVDYNVQSAIHKVDVIKQKLLTLV